MFVTIHQHRFLELSLTWNWSKCYRFWVFFTLSWAKIYWNCLTWYPIPIHSNGLGKQSQMGIVSGETTFRRQMLLLLNITWMLPLESYLNVIEFILCFSVAKRKFLTRVTSSLVPLSNKIVRASQNCSLSSISLPSWVPSPPV